MMMPVNHVFTWGGPWLLMAPFLVGGIFGKIKRFFTKSTVGAVICPICNKQVRRALPRVAVGATTGFLVGGPVGAVVGGAVGGASGIQKLGIKRTTVRPFTLRSGFQAAGLGLAVGGIAGRAAGVEPPINSILEPLKPVRDIAKQVDDILPPGVRQGDGVSNQQIPPTGDHQPTQPSVIVLSGNRPDTNDPDRQSRGEPRVSIIVMVIGGIIVMMLFIIMRRK